MLNYEAFVILKSHLGQNDDIEIIYSSVFNQNRRHQKELKKWKQTLPKLNSNRTKFVNASSRLPTQWPLCLHRLQQGKEAIAFDWSRQKYYKKSETQIIDFMTFNGGALWISPVSFPVRIFFICICKSFDLIFQDITKITFTTQNV